MSPLMVFILGTTKKLSISTELESPSAKTINYSFGTSNSLKTIIAFHSRKINMTEIRRLKIGLVLEESIGKSYFKVYFGFMNAKISNPRFSNHLGIDIESGSYHK